MTFKQRRFGLQLKVKSSKGLQLKLFLFEVQKSFRS